MANQRRFPEMLLSLEWAYSAESGRILNELGFARRARPEDPAARLAAFIPWLGIEFLYETAAPLGVEPLPRGDEPLPQAFRGFGWFLLGFVACLWKRLLEDHVRIDLKETSVAALSLLYMQCPEEVQGSEGFTVLSRFSQELFPSAQFKRYLESLEMVVDAYVIVRETRSDPVERKKVAALGTKLLSQMLIALEVRPA